MSILVNSWPQFARITIQTHDLDPMYDFINNARQVKGQTWADKFALHFFMFYDAGGAAAAADHKGDFWKYVFDNFDKFKRGTERRHYRSEKGLRAVKHMSKYGSPSMVWEIMHRPSYTELARNIEVNFVGCEIGPYFMWKAYDLMDRGLGLPISLSLSEAVEHMPDEPRKCAASVYPTHGLNALLVDIVEAIEDLPAPGAANRNCSYSEAETILCMMKGYFLTKSHLIGDDIEEKHMQLASHPEYIQFLPKRININDYQRGSLDPTIISVGSATVLS